MAKPRVHRPVTPLALLWATGAALSALLLHVDHVPLWASAAVVACAAWRLLALKWPLKLPGAVARAVLTLLLMAAVAMQFRTLNGLTAGTALLVAMAAVKLLETFRRRDLYIVVGVSLFLLIAACLDRQGLLRAPLYVLHAWLCCTALAIIGNDGGTIRNRAAVTLAARNLAIAAPIALVFFVLFPRVSGAFWSLPPTDRAVTGLSDTMSPGSITELTDSDEPVFRVRFIGRTPPREDFYWRGPVLHDFDGYTWRDLPGRNSISIPLQYLGEPYRYHITLEPHSRNWWYALDTVVQSPHPRVRLTFDNQLLSWQPVTQIMEYEAVSYTRTQSDVRIPILAKRYDTELPPTRNRRSVQLAREMHDRAGSDTAYVAAVLEMFRSQGFEYTLTPPRLDFDSVDDFIFNTRRGFCGHFASAFVTLMRAADVPSRVVTGYQGAEWNPVGRYFTVRQSDAHAWAEVWIAGRGWTRVDPTAVVSPERLRRGVFELLPDSLSAPARFARETAWINDTMLRWDALNEWWNSRVVKFDLRTQLGILEDLGFETPEWKHLGWLLAAGLVVWLLAVAWHVARTGRAPAPDRLARAYVRLCRKLARAGVQRQPHQGPLDFAQVVSRRRPDLADSTRLLLARYAELRFGRDPLAARVPDVVAFERAVSQLRAKPTS
jgi:transglutaminase-like putative cysteine protease